VEGVTSSPAPVDLPVSAVTPAVYELAIGARHWRAMVPVLILTSWRQIVLVEPEETRVPPPLPCIVV
jgi:hypothetical protein